MKTASQPRLSRYGFVMELGRYGLTRRAASEAPTAYSACRDVARVTGAADRRGPAASRLHSP